MLSLDAFVRRFFSVSQSNLLELPAFERTTTNLNVVVESPRGSSTKLKYNPTTDAFELSYILPAGSRFPFEFGFIPSTLGEDRDPLDKHVNSVVPAIPANSEVGPFWNWRTSPFVTGCMFFVASGRVGPD
jgi:hypothetical protein